MKTLFYIAAGLGMLMGLAMPVRAQDPVPPPAPEYQPLSDQQLDQLLGPIALYPDPLIAQILPAATLPTEIVLADRYVSGGGDPNQIDQQPWDPSVQALARYPAVLQWLDQNLAWTTEVGQAFLNQQPEVMESIQRLRLSASNLGNLQSTPQEQIIYDGGEIEIVPVDPQVFYLPVYQPDQVYYVAGNGAPFITFGIACAIGPWLDCDFDWANRNLIRWSRDHPRPANWWHESSRQRGANPAPVWRPDHRAGATDVRRGGGDRGWVQPQSSVVATVSRATPPQSYRSSTPAPRPQPAPVEHYAPASRTEPSGAFIGIQSSHDTRTFSNRGQQSIQSVTHAAPVNNSQPVTHSEPVSRPAMPSGGGGGGGHGSKH